MSYVIDAWLEQGEPHLKVSDAHTGALKLQWAYQSTSTLMQTEQDDCSCTCAAHRNLRGLFKSLFLLACADKLNLPERSLTAQFGEECIQCDKCSDSVNLKLR